MKKTKIKLINYREVERLRSQGVTFSKIGSILGFSRQRAEQIYKSGKGKKLVKLEEVKSRAEMLICEYCLKKCDEGSIKCEEDEVIIYYHRDCWRKVVFS